MAMSFKKSEELRKVKTALSQAQSFQRKAEKSGESSSVIKGVTKAVKKFKRAKKDIEQGEKTKEKIKSKIHRAVSGDIKAFKKPFLSKPKAKGPRPISAKKTLRSFANSTGPLVREVEEREVVQDNRSQFFRDEFRRENTGDNKWLS